MRTKILIIGSTGKLGSLILNFCYKKKIEIFGIACFSNTKKLIQQKNKYLIKNFFSLSNSYDKKNFLLFLSKNELDIIYFLDYGSYSLTYLDIILKNRYKSYIAIANKEMIIAGSHLINEKLRGKTLIPLDSEHFSLFNTNTKCDDIKKIYITASGGPFYFRKNIKIDKVKKKQVLSHPKWKMGVNNLIDSSNFVNKLLEIFELSSIYKININKVDFLVSKEAFIHSIVEYTDGSFSLNCFKNDMMIPLVKPLKYFFPDISLPSTNKYKDIQNYKVEKFNDNRFAIKKYLTFFKNLNHSERILFMILNNKAQKLYLDGNLEYHKILDFIYGHFKQKRNNIHLKSFNSILKYIKELKNYYEI